MVVVVVPLGRVVVVVPPLGVGVALPGWVVADAEMSAAGDR